MTSYYELVYHLISDYITHNNIAPFDTDPYYKTFKAIKYIIGHDRDYYANVFQYIIVHMRYHDYPFYADGDPAQIKDERDKMSMPILQHDGKIYLYDRFGIKDYIEVTNFNEWFEIAYFRKKYQLSWDKSAFMETKMTSLIYPYAFNHKRYEMKNMNLLVFGTPTYGEELSFAKFANQITTKNDFYFIGYDFETKKILPKPTLNCDTLKMLITPIFKEN